MLRRDDGRQDETFAARGSCGSEVADASGTAVTAAPRLPGRQSVLILGPAAPLRPHRTVAVRKDRT